MPYNVLRPAGQNRNRWNVLKGRERKYIYRTFAFYWWVCMVLHNFAYPIEFPSWVPRNHLSNTPKVIIFFPDWKEVFPFTVIVPIGHVLILLGIQWHLQPHCTEAQSLLHLTCHPLKGITSAFHLPPSPSTWLLSPCWLTSSVFSHQGKASLPLGSDPSRGAWGLQKPGKLRDKMIKEQASVSSTPSQGTMDRREKVLWMLCINTSLHPGSQTEENSEEIPAFLSQWTPS